MHNLQNELSRYKNDLTEHSDQNRKSIKDTDTFFNILREIYMYLDLSIVNTKSTDI